ncbi:MAG: amidohydrolase family protein [Pseudomonadota bacterium]
MTATHFANASLLDTKEGVLRDGHVLVREGRIAEVSEAPITATADRTIDLKGEILMPGLCDGHVHVVAVTANFPALIRMSPFYVMARAAPILEQMLMRGFTTVRDGGGADFGLAKAVDEGHLVGHHVKGRHANEGRKVRRHGHHVDVAVTQAGHQNLAPQIDGAVGGGGDGGLGHLFNAPLAHENVPVLQRAFLCVEHTGVGKERRRHGVGLRGIGVSASSRWEGTAQGPARG